MQCTCHLVLQFSPIYPCMVLPAQKNKNSNAWVGDISQHTNQSLVPNHFHISSEQVNFMPGICIYGMQEKGTTLLKIGSLQSFHYLRVNALLWAMQTASLCSCNLAMPAPANGKLSQQTSGFHKIKAVLGGGLGELQEFSGLSRHDSDNTLSIKALHFVLSINTNEWKDQWQCSA